MEQKRDEKVEVFVIFFTFTKRVVRQSVLESDLSFSLNPNANISEL